MPWYSIKEQDERLREIYPSFKLTNNIGLYATWEGTLRPISQTYRIWIRYVPERFLDTVTLQHSYVTVKVLDPVIAPDVRGTGERTPHVYRYRQPVDRPALCAWDPTDEPFSPLNLIAEEIIPAVIRWLVFFEDWLDTGAWRGGGKHPDPDSLRFNEQATRAGLSACVGPVHRAAAELARRIGSWTSMPAISRARFGDFPSVFEEADIRHRRLLGRKFQLIRWPIGFE